MKSKIWLKLSEAGVLCLMILAFVVPSAQAAPPTPDRSHSGIRTRPGQPGLVRLCPQEKRS